MSKKLTLQQSIDSIISIQDEIVKSIFDTLIMMGLSVSFACVTGGVLGIFLYLTSANQLFANQFVHKVLGGFTNFMRAFPFIILMIAMGSMTKIIVGTKIGPIAASLVLAVAGSFYFARLVEQNLREVPRGIIEATESMGATPFTIIKVLLNEARSGLILSITILCITLLSASAAAGMIGGGGLGDLAVRYGHMRSRDEITIFVVLVLSIFVVVIQGVGNWLATKIDKR